MKKLILWIATGFVVISYPLFIKFLNHEREEEAFVPPAPANNNQISPTVTPSETLAPSASVNQSPTPTKTVSLGKYKDGAYTGSSADAFYGYIQVKVTVSQGKITKVDFLQYPNDRGHSILINQYAMPILEQEAISAQSANVDTVSGATDTSIAFKQSLSSALNQAI